MRPIRVDESVFNDLASTRGEDLISILLPTHKKSRDVDQDRIRLKNQLSAVDDTLTASGWKPRQRSERLARAYELLDDLEFWEHQDAGLAIYVDDQGEMVPVATTRPLTDAAFVTPVFILRPLAAELNGLSLPVLALTRAEVSLFRASRLRVDEIRVNLPSYDDVNWFVDREKERQQHPTMAGTGGGRHGHEPSDRSDEDLARFLREVDSAIATFDGQTPLIVLGDDEVVARFGQVSRRPTLTAPRSGVRAPFSPSEILEKVEPLITEVEDEQVMDAETAVRDQLGVGMAAVDVEEAVPAALSGRVARILIGRTAPPIWGRFDEKTLETEVHSSHEPGDVDLLDRLVVWARETGAEIVSTEAMSDGRTFVATFRY